MMDFQLTVPAIIRRAEALSAEIEIVSRSSGGTIHRYSYGTMIGRAKHLAAALQQLGVKPGDRVASLNWNNHEHLETYFATPLIGAVLHTLNPRLNADDLAYTVNHAGDTVLVVDHSLLPLYEAISDRVNIKHVIVSGLGDINAPFISYERSLAGSVESALCETSIDEQQAAVMCHSSGTTGRPKGVVYSHRALALMAMHWTAADAAALSRRDVVLAVVPMFHINGWCLPYAAALVGAKLVLPGRALGAESLLELLDGEGATLSAGVPAVWASILHELEVRDHAHSLTSLERLVLGGSAVPETLMRDYQTRHGVRVIQAWGMTETTSLATTWSHDARGAATHDIDWQSTQGVPLPFVEVRARNEKGELVAWDGASQGELEVRGATVIGGYYASRGDPSPITDDKWLRTGDIVTIDRNGSVKICDRTKDLIKSGGEWISSVALENFLMSHPAVAEAAVIAVPDERWGERPLAVVVLKPGADASAEDLTQHLLPKFVKWSLPDHFEFVDEIPKTSTGKVQKSELRRRYRDHPVDLCLSSPHAET